MLLEGKAGAPALNQGVASLAHDVCAGETQRERAGVRSWFRNVRARCGGRGRALALKLVAHVLEEPPGRPVELDDVRGGGACKREDRSELGAPERTGSTRRALGREYVLAAWLSASDSGSLDSSGSGDAAEAAAAELLAVAVRAERVRLCGMVDEGCCCCLECARLGYSTLVFANVWKGFICG